MGKVKEALRRLDILKQQQAELVEILRQGAGLGWTV
jgi:hypothetical protein